MEVDQLLTTLKLLIIGESSVGKSSLLLRFTDDAFDPEQAATIGVDFMIKTVEIDGEKIKVRYFLFLCFKLLLTYHVEKQKTIQSF